MIFNLHTIHTLSESIMEIIYAVVLRTNGSVAKIHIWLSTVQGSILTIHCVLDRRGKQPLQTSQTHAA
jgi:hypothetical protein